MTTTRNISAATLALLLASTRAAGAQSPDSTFVVQKNGWEVLASSGALVPAGAQRAALKDAAFSTAQLFYVIRSRVAITTSVGWARSRNLAAEGAPKISVFTYDAGLELRAMRLRQLSGLTLTPFAGAGAGGRSYDHRGRDIDATHNVAGYASLGGELGMGRVRLRIEARDYVSGFKPLTGNGRTATRQDFTILAGLRLAKKHAAD